MTKVIKIDAKKNNQLRKLHRELCSELSDLKTAHMTMGVQIADMRGQIDTIFEKHGTVLHNPVTCDYQGLFKNIKTHNDRSIFEGLEHSPSFDPKRRAKEHDQYKSEDTDM
jgi:hypothetical protein